MTLLGEHASFRSDISRIPLHDDEFVVMNHHDLLNDLEYRLYVENNALTSGSGADPVYIFAKTGIEKFTGMPRSIKTA